MVQLQVQIKKNNGKSTYDILILNSDGDFTPAELNDAKMLKQLIKDKLRLDNAKLKEVKR